MQTGSILATIRSAAAILGLSLMFASTASASEVLYQAYGPDTDPLNVTVNSRFIGNADMEHDRGSYSVSQYGAAIDYKWFSLTYNKADYHWSDVSSLAFGNGKDDPWDSLQTLSFGAKTDGRFNENLGWFVGGTVISGFEKDMEDSFSLFYRGGFTYRFNDEWSGSLGIMGLASELNPMVSPLVTINWRNPRDLGWSASIGVPATYAVYRFNDWAALRGSVAWERSQHRLADDSDVARKGYVQQEATTTGIYFDVTPIERLSVTVGAEYLLGRKMELYDREKDKIDSMEVDDALAGVLRVKYTF